MIGLVIEGHGENGAVQALVKKLLKRDKVYGLRVDTDAYRMSADQMTNDKKMSKVMATMRTRGAGAVLIVRDADDECPVTLASSIIAAATRVAPDIPVEVVIADREYETWLLSSVETLRPFPTILDSVEWDADWERKRDAKGELTRLMSKGNSYKPTTNQKSFTELLDLELVETRSRSFRKMVKAFRSLSAASGFPIET